MRSSAAGTEQFLLARSRVVKVPALHLIDLSSYPSRVIPRTLKMMLTTIPLGIQQETDSMKVKSENLLITSLSTELNGGLDFCVYDAYDIR